MKPMVCGLLIDGTKFFRGYTHLVAANAERHDRFGLAAFCGTDNVHSRFGSELPRGIKNPIYAKPLLFKWLGSAQNRSEIRIRLLFAKQHHADGKRDLCVDHALAQEMLSQVARDERIVARLSQKGS